jgi:hypothetical protein
MIDNILQCIFFLIFEKQEGFLFSNAALIFVTA